MPLMTEIFISSGAGDGCQEVGALNNLLNSILMLLIKAEQGDAVAQGKLGDMYWRGQDVLQDYAQAADWYREAAEQGNADAEDNLGTMYYIEFLEGYASSYAILDSVANIGNDAFAGCPNLTSVTLSR